MITVVFSGQVTVGAWLSSTVTVWLHVAVFPLASVAVQWTMVVPLGKAAGASLLKPPNLPTTQLEPASARAKLIKVPV